MNGHRVLVTFTEEQWTLLQSLRGLLGRGDADTVRTIVISWFVQQGMLSESIRGKREEGVD
jgi:hypothetical protein